MFSRQLSRQVLARTALLRSTARVAVPVHVGSVFLPSSRRSILTEASLAPMDELSDARQKLRQVFLDYRQQNFAQTLFSRFVKEMILATDSNHDGKISKRELRTMLKNIGMDQVVTQEDVDAVFEEIGHQEENGEYLIFVDEIEAILTQPAEMS